MALTLAVLCDSALEEAGLDPIGTYVGSSDTAAKRLVRLAKRECDSQYKNDVPHQMLRETYTFNLATATQTYALPSDFGWMRPNTQWDRTRRRGLLGGTDDATWQFLSAYTTRFGLNWFFRIRGNLFEIQQEVTSSENGNEIAYDYVKNTWARSTGGTPQSTWLADTDTCVFEDELTILGITWRVKKSLGFDHMTDLAEYNAERIKYYGRGYSPPTILLSPPATRGVPFRTNVPDQGYG